MTTCHCENFTMQPIFPWLVSQPLMGHCENLAVTPSDCENCEQDTKRKKKSLEIDGRSPWMIRKGKTHERGYSKALTCFKKREKPKKRKEKKSGGDHKSLKGRQRSSSKLLEFFFFYFYVFSLFLLILSIIMF